MICRSVMTVALCFLATALIAADAPRKTRTALVIGNARYEAQTGKLRNTANDARLVAETLRSLGFRVIEKHDVTRDQLLRATEEFRKTLPGSEVAFFYYAGHGISVGGENYLIPLKSGFDPANADATTLRMMAETRLFNVQQAVADMSAAGSGCNLIVLDACRNTPLARNPQARSLTRGGLSEMAPPAGSLIAFATDAGQTARDGEGTNGLYTKELLKHLRSPDLTIEQVFKRTRADVVRLSNGTQIPAEYSRLIGDDIYLAGQLRPPETTASNKDEETTPDKEPGISPNAETLKKLALSGQTEACLEGLKLLVHNQGPGAYTIPPLDAVLEVVKNSLDATAPSSSIVEKAEKTCAAVLRILPDCLALDDPKAALIAAKAYNRRGDALLLLNRPEEAIEAYNLALSLTPENSYIIYNRGRAKLALGQKEEAKADFAEASKASFDQPKARKLAQEALAQLK